jgi:hypothetical protein
LAVGLTLYAPDGSVVPSGNYTASSPDGRNVHIEYTAAAGGLYRVDVHALSGSSGTYLLKVTGSTVNIDHTPPTVVSSNLADGAVLPPGDLSFTAQFSEGLATTGLGFDDVVLTNTDTNTVIPLAPHGLKGEYWNIGTTINNLSEVNFNATPTATRTDAQVNFGDGQYSGDAAGMAGLGLYDYYAARWTGSIRLDTAGAYTFYTSSDDGSRLYIDGSLVVNNDNIHPKNRSYPKLNRITTVFLAAQYRQACV